MSQTKWKKWARWIANKVVAPTATFELDNGSWRRIIVTPRMGGHGGQMPARRSFTLANTRTTDGSES